MSLSERPSLNAPYDGAPPFTAIVTPETKDAASEHRKPMTAAVSSARWARPRGIRRASQSENSIPSLAAKASRPGFGNRSVGATARGATALHRIPCGPSSAAKTRDELINRRSSRTDRSGANRGTDGCMRGQQDQRPGATPADHGRSRSLRQRPGTRQVHVQRSLPGRTRHLDQTPVARIGAGSAVENAAGIDAAQGANGLRDQAGPVVFRSAGLP